jgi:ribosomal protein S24E
MTPMEIKVSNEAYNPLLKRREITLEIEHTGEGTPQRYDIRKRMASKLSAKIENVFVVSLDTSTGLQRSTCSLQVYDDSRAASSAIPEHIAIRNLPPEERAKVKEAKAAKPEKARKPAEKREAKPSKEAEARPAARAEAKAQAEPPKTAK